MDKSLSRCQIHNQRSYIFCKNCRRVICQMCKECEKHDIENIKRLIDGYKHLLQPWNIEKFVSVARALSNKINEAISNEKQLLLTLEKEEEQINQIIDKTKEGGAEDLKLIEESILYLRGVQEKTSTAVLKEAIETAIFALDVDAKIEKEVSKSDKKMTEHIEAVSKHKKHIKDLELKFELLNPISEAKDNILSDEVELALSLCFVNNFIDPTSFKITHTISKYKAFDSVRKIFDIEKVKTQELSNVGAGVKVSTPLVVEKKLNGGDSMFSSLSHNGVLAIHCSDSSGNKVQLTDLLKERQVEIDVDNTTHTGFYDDFLVMLTWKNKLGVCLVEKMFLNKNASVLKRIGDVDVSPYTDVSLLHSTRKLAFKSTSLIPYEFDVDTGMINKLDEFRYIYPFASITGIEVGKHGAFYDYLPLGSPFLIKGQKTTSIKLSCNLYDLLCIFIPSSSDPGNLKKGMKIYRNGSFFTDENERAQLITPFKYQDYQSIVRLYQNIFLVYNANTKKWCLVKIIVP